MDLTDPKFWGWVIFVGEWAIRLVMTVVVPFRRSPTTAKGWLLLIYFEPIFGLVAFILLGRVVPPRWRREQLRRLPGALSPMISRVRKHPRISRPQVPAELTHAVTLAENLGHMPILGGNHAELLPEYDGIIDRLVADIDAARHHVHLLFYIFADDATGGRVADALARAVRREVKCRVLVDALGSRPARKRLIPRMKKAGIEVHEMLPLGLPIVGRFFSRKVARFDLRNHRKIAVVDGHIGYTGSQNIVDATFKPGIVYEELVVRVTGPVVLELQYTFVADWFLETEEVLDQPDVFPMPEFEGQVAAQVLPSGPVFPTQNNQRLLVALIHGARQRVVITTPYFIPDDALLQAMQTAVARGVQVHLLVSRKADQLLVGLAQRSYYDDLLEAGVVIHQYRKHFLHAKHLSIDDEVAAVGSSNMDIRSFALNDEILLLLYDPKMTGRLRQIQDHYFAGAEVLKAEAWAKRGMVAQALENLARLLSPLL